MPEKATLDRARKDKAEGKAPSTQAGEFVREEIDHIREGKHGAKSAKQAIAIGLSKARRAGVALQPPKEGRTSEATRKSAQRDLARGKKKSASGSGAKKKSARRSRATSNALKREPRSAASHAAMSRQARSAAKKRKQSGPATTRSGSSRSSSSRKTSQRRPA
jgi:uncharacterized protein DUF6496